MAHLEPQQFNVDGPLRITSEGRDYDSTCVLTYDDLVRSSYLLVHREYISLHFSIPSFGVYHLTIFYFHIIVKRVVVTMSGGNISLISLNLLGQHWIVYKSTPICCICFI